jgi:pyruvate kinase
MQRFTPLMQPFTHADLHAAGEEHARVQMSFLSKLEAIASSSVRVAEKAAAKLIIVFTDTGLTAALVAKYRPTVPILTLVIPRLVNQDLQWRIIGRHVARQCMLTRGLVPMLAAPSPDGERVLRDAVKLATSRKLLRAGDHAVCVEKISGDYCIKMVSVDESGTGVKEFEPLSGGALVHTGSMLPRNLAASG